MSDVNFMYVSTCRTMIEVNSKTVIPSSTWGVAGPLHNVPACRFVHVESRAEAQSEETAV